MVDFDDGSSPVAASVDSVQLPSALRIMPGRFNPDPILGAGCSIWRGSAGGLGLAGAEETDWRESLFRVVDFTEILSETYLRGVEVEISGEEKLRRMKADDRTVVRLGGKSFLALWNDLKTNGENSTLEFLRKVRYIKYLDFPGVVVRTMDGKRCLPCFHYRYRREMRSGRWNWGVRLLSSSWDNNGLSASIRA